MDVSRSTVNIAVAQIVSKVAGLVGTVLFARILGPEKLGTYFIFQAALGILTIFTDFGISGALVKRLSEEDSSEAVFGTAVVLVTALVLATSVIVSTVLNWSDIQPYSKFTNVLVVGLFLREYRILLINSLRGELRVSITAPLEALQKIAWLVLGFLFVTLESEAISLVYALLAGNGLVILISVFLSDAPVRWPTKTAAISLIDYAKYNIVGFVEGHLRQWTDTLLIGAIVGQSAVGAYEIAWRIASSVMIFPAAIQISVLPQISSWDTKDEKQLIEDLIPQSLFGSFALVVPSFFGVVLLSPEIITQLFGKSYLAASVPLIVLMFGKILSAVEMVLKSLLSGLDKPDLRAKAVVIGLILNILLNVVFISAFGILGAAVATTLSVSLTAGITWWLSQPLIHLRFPRTEFVYSVIASTVMLLVLFILTEYIPMDTWYEIAMMIFVGAIIYTSVILLPQKTRRAVLWYT